MDSNTQVQADDESFQVEAESGAGTQGKLPGELVVVDESVLQFPYYSKFLLKERIIFGRQNLGTVAPCPYVPGIDKGSAKDFPYDGETQLEVRFEFDVTGMEDTLVIVEAVEIAGAIGIRPGRPQTVGPSCIKRFGKRSGFRVSQRYVGACENTGCDANLFRQVEPVAEFGGELDILVEGEFENG